jgi:REP element-mobilizing transposase RayT
VRRARWLASWKNSPDRPVIYHCISRVVDRRFVLGDEERESFRMFMRIQENFSGCRVLSYCIMSNHFHLLLEVPPIPEGGFSDDELLKRISTLYSEAKVAEVAAELKRAREFGYDKWIAEIHANYTYRMHDLSEFMKTLLQRFTCWFNRNHDRTGTLWEQRYKSVIVQDGEASKTMAAYIDLNPVRAGMVEDPADYRWSSYGEAIGGGIKGNGKKARAGLVRALRAHKGVEADASLWTNDVSHEYRDLLMDGAMEKTEQRVSRRGRQEARVTRKGVCKSLAEHEMPCDREMSMSRMLRCRVRYFTDGAVIGSRAFVNEVFVSARERFGPKRKDGARRMRGDAAAAAEKLWSMRDLRVGV